MKFEVIDLDIATGGIKVVLLNHEDALMLDLHVEDRIVIKKGKKKTIAILDIAESSKVVPRGTVGVFEEVLDILKLKSGSLIEIDIAKKPESIQHIKKKLDGKKLKEDELDDIIKDVVKGELDAIELTYFVSGCYMHGLDNKETLYLTRSIRNNGDTLKIKRNIIVDKHCTGGVAGNRTTMIVVPIITAAGLTMPKTSSRSITSPAGTADTMEVLAPVALPIKKMESVVKKTGGCIVWGGGINLASADDKLIKVRHPLSLDPEGMMLASILAKKASVNSNRVLIDIPIGIDTKIKTKKTALRLKKRFKTIGEYLGMKVKVIITDGTQPIGNGIGPALEAIDVLKVLRNDVDAPEDLINKSIKLANIIFKMTGHKQIAKEILASGKAYDKMKEIIKEQGGKIFVPEKIKVGKFTKDYVASKSGIIVDIKNNLISKIARVAGAPIDKGAGLFMHVRENMTVKKGQPLFTIYAHSKQNLEFAYNAIDGVVKIK